MAYTALYRKFRPLTFADMVGQEHITRTLKNQIMAGRVGHAYLFSGGRGTGKTSSAKILARAINCLNPKDGEPCNKCEICKGILAGSLTDVIEMDAASNNSVEDIRSIREEVNFLPTLAKYRVYIIDEVHMLSTGAFNALLKTLEEPPEHVKFILATTEPQKLPATILSRCQRFDFKRIQKDDIIKRLTIICEQSNIEITKEALDIIANLSEGAMRDAISILERCIQDGEKQISEDKIKDLVGIPKLTYINDITKAILTYDVEKALSNVEEILNEGKDLNYFLWEIIKYMKDLMLYKTGSNLPLYNQKEKEEMEKLFDLCSKERLLKLIYSLSELDNQMKWSSQKNIALQVGIMKACSQEENQGIEELQKRISKLEHALANGTVITQSTEIIPETQIKKEEKKTSEQIEKKQPKETKKQPQETENQLSDSWKGEKVSYWQEIIEELKKNGKIMLYSNLMDTKAIKLNDLIIGIQFPKGITSFGKAVLEKPENKQALMQIVSLKEGKEMQIRYLEPEKKQNGIKQEQNPLENLGKELDIPINIIEE